MTMTTISAQKRQIIAINRTWAMPSPWTFSIKPIACLIKEEMNAKERWIDPFAGKYSPASIRNDINPQMPAEYHKDALEFLSEQPSEAFDGGLLDWPYSLEQYRISYKSSGLPIDKRVFNARYQARVKDELARVIKIGGTCICFGWNSGGLGKKRNFQVKKILLVAHGRMHNDTIVTVEEKKKLQMCT